jgi:hypothetical protein
LTPATVGQGFQTALPADLAALSAHFGHYLRDQRAGGLGSLWSGFGLSYGLHDDAAGILDRVKAFASALWHSPSSHRDRRPVKLKRFLEILKLTHYPCLHNLDTGFRNALHWKSHVES